METVNIGGRRYSDPDILSLARQTGGLIDPRFTIRMQARQLLDKLLSYPGVPANPLERLKILASLNGIKIRPMNIETYQKEKRDAALYRTEVGWLLLYNPNRLARRLLFTIAHEIIHTLFPNSVTGARFRTITNPDSREANELERLCDLGAAELVMPVEDFQTQANGCYTLHNLETLLGYFGTSFEATAYRMASAHPGFAVSGLLRFRHTVDQERRVRRTAEQTVLFSNLKAASSEPAEKKYRRQSLHLSDKCGDQYIIRWNKSFDSSSVVYQAHKGGVRNGFEKLPNLSNKMGRIEAVLAPYRHDAADPEFGDVIFFWEEM